jgi:hypothetical protein
VDRIRFGECFCFSLPDLGQAIIQISDGIEELKTEGILRISKRYCQSDRYIGEVYATKQFVSREEEEGYRIIIEEHHDPEMLRTLKEYYSKTPA